jgi:hypothetical protein
MRYLIITLLLLCSSGHTRAWGDNGHKVIALIAWHYLSPATRNDIEALLQHDHSGLTAIDFVSEATWADAYRDSDRDGSRKRYEQTRRWHYINLEIGHPDFSRACFDSPPLQPQQNATDGPARACITDKIEQFAMELKVAKTPTAERLFALQFLIHLVGDLHQPMHASDSEDSGGNDVYIQAKSFKRGTLHGYWDNRVVVQLGRKPETIARKLIEAIDSKQIQRWRHGIPRDWALETFTVARDTAYASLPPANGEGIHSLDAQYEIAAKVAAAQQLMKAGVRLAWLLEQKY